MIARMIREATEADVPLILQFIRDLADYEPLAERRVATEGLVMRAGGMGGARLERAVDRVLPLHRRDQPRRLEDHAADRRRVGGNGWLVRGPPPSSAAGPAASRRRGRRDGARPAGGTPAGRFTV